VRIIGGSLRGSRLDVPASPGLRPTPDRVRETLFNWLAPVIPGARCLDLFAGTGALGIEAISRGAAGCVFVERDRRLAELLRGNLVRLRVSAGEVANAGADAFLAGEPRPFDIVFLDPPFEAGLWQASAVALEQGGWLRSGAWIYLESPAQSPPPVPPAWTLHREARAGTVRHALYRRRGDDPLS
jgi:16S rRNA (guanine966-N2)-methyltransferase